MFRLPAVLCIAALAGACGVGAWANARCPATAGEFATGEIATRTLGDEGSFEWDYEGGVTLYRAVEVMEASRSRTALGIRFCANGYCAHGFGQLDTAGDWSYQGEFHNGYLHGYGHLDSDWFSYSGCLKFGKLHGDGELFCDGGERIAGEFVEDTFGGRPTGWAALCP